MPSDPPHTPPSPSQSNSGDSDLPSKPVSPRPTHSLPTPAHSINGSMSSIPDPVPDTTTNEELTNKRKREIEDSGDRDLKKVHVEDSRLSIEDLHVDVGEKYLLCKTPHVRKGPDTTADLFELYNFTELAASVARLSAENPNGKRIRKTYKGVFKNLSGNFDADKREKFTPGTLSEMVTIPDFEWNAHMVAGKDIMTGFDAATLSAMSSAFTMARGPIPKKAWNKNVLGDVAGSSTTKASTKPGVKPSVSVAKTPVTTQAAPPQSSTANELQRPKRAGAKRRYGENHYDGYQGFAEGGLDEERPGDSAYSDGDGEDDDGSRKRFKKVCATGSMIYNRTNMEKSASNHNFAPLRQQSYGPGAIGA